MIERETTRRSREPAAPGYGATTNQRMARVRVSYRLLVVPLLLAAFGATVERPDLTVVGTLTPYAAIARELVAPGTRVESIAEARQDAHFVHAKPSYSILLANTDLLVGTGLDLELWLPAVVDKSRNPRIRPGEPGFVSVATDVPMLQVPDSPDRSAGDIHIFGNPHVHTDPLRAVMIAANIRVGLTRVDPGNAELYEARFENFKDRIHRRLFGPDLVDLVGGDRLAQLEMAHRLIPFLEATVLGGAPLSDRLGGWMGAAACLRGRRIIAYHLNWIYLFDRFGIESAAYVERKPGIPPSASHVAELVDLVRREGIRGLWVANYFDLRVPELLAERTGAAFAHVPLYPNESTDYFALVETWLQRLRAIYPGCSP